MSKVPAEGRTNVISDSSHLTCTRSALTTANNLSHRRSCNRRRDTRREDNQLIPLLSLITPFLGPGILGAAVFILMPVQFFSYRLPTIELPRNAQAVMVKVLRNGISPNSSAGIETAKPLESRH